MRISIRYQILIVIVAVLVVAIGSYLYLATSSFARDRTAYSFDLVSTVAQAKSDEIVVLLSAYRKQARLISWELDRGAATAGSASRERLRGFFVDEPSLLALDIWRINDAEPEIVMAVRNESGAGPVQLSESDLRTLHGDIAQTLTSIATVQTRVINVSLPPDIPLLAIAVASPERAVVFYVTPDELLRLISDSPLYNTYIVDEAGRVIIHSDRVLMLQRAELGEAQAVQESLRGTAQHAVHELGVGPDAVLAAYSRADLGRMTVVAEIRKATALAAIGTLNQKTALFGLAVLFAVLALGTLVSWRLAKPLLKLEEAAMHIGRGNFDVGVSVGTGTEVARLATAFNTMAREVANREKSLKDAYGQIQQQDRMALVGTLAAGVAHEINNPLTWVIGNQKFVADFLDRVEAILATPGDLSAEANQTLATELKDAREAIADLADGADRVRLIVRDLKMFSRSEVETLTPTDPRSALEAATKMAAHELKARAQVVRRYDHVPSVMANEARLGQVFLNLIINAAQALPTGRRDQNEIRLKTSTGKHGEAVIEVIDSGPGIPPEVVEKIFEPFYTTKPIGVGTGLGLTICNSIITEFGGSIAVESAAGHGTTVRVTLPPGGPMTEPKLAVEEPEVRLPSRSKLLIIDDERSAVSLWARVLRGRFVVHVATGGKEALRILDDVRDIDAVLCDLHMPEITGMEVFERAVAARPELASKFVFMTGGVYSPASRAFVESTSRPVLDKPFDPPDLFEALEGILTPGGATPPS